MTGQDPYCYPGTDVLINKLGIRDKQALQTAETEISTLRLAQLNFRMPTPTASQGGYTLENLSVLDGLEIKRQSN